MSETLLDVKGMNCPLPVLRANRALRTMAPGQRLRVLATDRAAVADFQAFCQETGHAMLAWSEEAGVFSFVIRRRPEKPSGEAERSDARQIGQPLPETRRAGAANRGGAANDKAPPGAANRYDPDGKDG
jgi:tRNA 2-thiouridine synthesizing protein A